MFTPDAILKRAQESPPDAFAQILSLFPGVDRSSLLKQLSLHMPQYSRSENSSPKFIKNEAQRLASRLQLLRSPFLDNIPAESEVPVSLQNLQFDTIDEYVAKIVLEHFHYLMSFRESSIHLGVRVQAKDKWPVAMVTLSPFDLANIAPALPPIDGQEANAIVLSRAFAFDVAPRNTMSYLLSRVRTWIAVHMPEVNLLVTYLNPNVGFTGASYKADNWTLLGREWGTRYYYLNRNYITDRKIYNQFGQAPQDMVESWQTYGISVSRHSLLPLELYIRGITKTRRTWRLQAMKFERWVPDGDLVAGQSPTPRIKG